MAEAQRAIPDDNLAYPVLITLKNGSAGSGFFLNDGKALYLVTAKHVLFDPATQKLLDVALDLLCYSKDPADSTRNLLSLDLSVLQNDGNIKPHPSEDVAVVKVFTLYTLMPGKGGAFTLSLVPGVTAKESSKGGVLGAALDVVKPFDQVLIGNDVMVFGYPISLGLQQLPKLDIHRPLLRKGIVAGTNPEKRSIILDCPSYFGNSGGPVLELDREAFRTRLRIIGVISQYIPFVDTGGSKTFVMQMATNSGYSIATPMDFVLDLIK
jgi:S1-C subfamily serine protease